MSVAVTRLFEGIASYIEDLRVSLEKEPAVDAGLLDEKVRYLTEQINALPLQERLSYREHLDQMQEALKVLEAEMQNRKEDLRKRLEGMQEHKQANTTYRAANVSDKQGG